MTTPTFGDYVVLAKRERDLSDYRRQLHTAIDGGNATELMVQRERAVSAERRALHRQIDTLKAELWPSPKPKTEAKRRSWF